MTTESEYRKQLNRKIEVTPKINDKFRFDDGTIGTIQSLHEYNDKPVIGVYSSKFGWATFPIADLTLYQAPVTSNAIWTVKG